jgi:hypothetical protein
VETFDRIPQAKVATQILARYSALTPEVRTEVVTKLLDARTGCRPSLMPSPTEEFPMPELHTTAGTYMKHGDKKIREQAIP